MGLSEGAVKVAAHRLRQRYRELLREEIANTVAGPGEVEAAALKAWEEAEKLFAAKDMKAAGGAYEAFEREYAKTQTMARQAAR